MSWGKFFTEQDYPAGTFVVGEMFVIHDREHIILEVHESGRGVTAVTFDGESNRPQRRYRISVEKANPSA